MWTLQREGYLVQALRRAFQRKRPEEEIERLRAELREVLREKAKKQGRL